MTSAPIAGKDVRVTAATQLARLAVAERYNQGMYELVLAGAEQLVAAAERRAYERCAEIIDARCAEVLSKQSGEEYPHFGASVDMNLRMSAMLLPDLAAAIRALIKNAEELANG